LAFVIIVSVTSSSIQTDRSKKPGTTEEEKEGPASINVHATRINLHEYEDDEKGNGLEHIERCREAKSCEVEVKI